MFTVTYFKLSELCVNIYFYKSIYSYLVTTTAATTTKTTTTTACTLIQVTECPGYPESCVILGHDMIVTGWLIYYMPHLPQP